MISYKFFESPEEFEFWQVECERKIISITPFAGGIDMNLTDEGETGTAKGRVCQKVFVVFRKD